jgi:hypothetical protein
VKVLGIEEIEAIVCGVKIKEACAKLLTLYWPPAQVQVVPHEMPDPTTPL